MAVLLVSMDLFALAKVPAGPDEAGGPPPTKFYKRRDNVLTAGFRSNVPHGPFPVAGAAIAAGYNGCYTCQRQFNVVAAGLLFVKASRPASETAFQRPPTLELTYAGNAKRFGIPVGPLTETRERMEGRRRGDQVDFEDSLDFLVPGPWTLALHWDGATVTGAVDVRKHWRDGSGLEHGQRTLVKHVKGGSTLTVTHQNA